MACATASTSTASSSPDASTSGRIRSEQPRPAALSWVAVAACLLAVVLFLRKPDSLLNPQFWAEDGTFFLEAYDHGLWWTITRPIAGYLNTVPRLVAGLAVLFPLRAAPLLFNLAAFFVQMLPVLYLLSDRMGRWIPDRRLRVVVAFLYVSAPNSYETYVILDNSQWNLALAALVLLLADPPQSRLGYIGDLALLILFACTGPIAIFLLPLALQNLLRQRHGGQRRWFSIQCAIVAAGAAVQMALLLVVGRPPPADSAWPTLQELLKILSTHIFFNSLLGIHGTIEFSSFLTPAVEVAGLALTVMLATVALARRYRPLVWLLYLSGMTVCSSLLFTASRRTAWLSPTFGSRYYLYATLFVLYAIVWLCARRGRLRALGALLALPVLGLAIPRDFAHPGDFADIRRPDTRYADQVAVFETLPAGASFYIPTQPEGWGGFVLRRKSAARGASPLAGLRFIGGEPDYFLDAPEVTTVFTGGADPYVHFSGWAVDTAAKEVAGGVWLEVDGKLFPAVTGEEADQAELLLRDRRGRMAGFSRDIPLSEIGFGTHRLSMVVLTADRTGYYRIPWRFFSLSAPEPA